MKVPESVWQAFEAVAFNGATEGQEIPGDEIDLGKALEAALEQFTKELQGDGAIDAGAKTLSAPFPGGWPGWRVHTAKTVESVLNHVLGEGKGGGDGE